uniref:ABC transporter, ATP-binding protein n=1 Tax=Parascaris equorum TaxID=6256 RepID=A0A914RLR9_PAREQ
MCYLTACENMNHRMRKEFFKAVIRQDIGWFDENQSGTLTAKLFDNLERVKEGTGDKIALMIQFMSQFFAGFIIAFTYDWRLTLIMMSLSPFMKYSHRFERSSLSMDKKLNVTVEVTNRISHRYNEALKGGMRDGILKSLYVGIGLGLTFFIIFGSYALAFWVGTGYYSAVHSELPVQYSQSSIGVNPGETVALVGTSGCGKSTIVSLLLRYYNPEYGNILIDGHEISSLNLAYLRKMIGVVSQEPVLFNMTIKENIEMGNEDVTEGEILAACRRANATNFINQLPNKYETIVGDRGTQLSGGQKQRIAIARALVRNPKILLLDEATSALDAESESIVQEALEKAAQGRTTIVIAHRLSTIKNADKIIAMKDGRIIEIGTHNELIAANGFYRELVNAQVFADVDEKRLVFFSLYESKTARN